MHRNRKKEIKLIGAGLATIGLAGTGVGMVKTSVRTMHTVVSKTENKSSGPLSPFMEEMLKWENPEIDLSHGINYSGIKSIAIFFKKIGYESFISFFDSSKTGARFISSKLENIGSRINFNLENFKFDSLSHSNLSISFKSMCYHWVPYRPEGFIRETLLFLFQHWHMTSVVVGATVYFIYMHFFNDANDSSSTENNSTSRYITEPDVAVIPTATSDDIMGEQSINDDSGSEGSASPEEHIIDAGSVSGESAAAAGDRLSPPTVVGGGGDVESKEAEAPIKASFILETRIPKMLAYFKFKIITDIISELQPIVIDKISVGRPTWDYDIDQIMSQVFKTRYERVINIQDDFDCYVEGRARDAGVTTAVFIIEILDKTIEERLVFGDAFIASVSSHFIAHINNDVISDFLNRHYNTTDF